MNDSHELVWIKGRIYQLEAKFRKIIKLLEEASQASAEPQPLAEKLIKILRGLPLDE